MERIVHDNNLRAAHWATVILEGGSACGIVSTEGPTAGWVHNVSVIPEKRGKGLGNALLSAIEEVAVENLGRTRLYLNTDPKTAKWYKRHGWRHLKNCRTGGHGHLVTLIKILSDNDPLANN